MHGVAGGQGIRTISRAKLRRAFTGYSAARTSCHAGRERLLPTKRCQNAASSTKGASNPVLSWETWQERLGTWPVAYRNDTASGCLPFRGRLRVAGPRKGDKGRSGEMYSSSAALHAAAEPEPNGAGTYSAREMGPCHRSASSLISGSLHNGGMGFAGCSWLQVHGCGLRARSFCETAAVCLAQAADWLCHGEGMF